MAGGVAIPEVPVVKELSPQGSGKDDTARIQAEIDALSAVKPNGQGIRGALLLKRGLYRVSGTLKVGAFGVVIRGEGQGADGTILLGTGRKPRSLIVLGGKTKLTEIKGSRYKITDAYVPWGAKSFSMETTQGYSVGDAVIVYRPSTAAWIADIHMNEIVPRPGTVQWIAGAYDLNFERTITAIKGNRITLDASVVNAMEEKYGGGYVYRYQQEGRLTNVGVEYVRLDSEYQVGKENEDEAHAWTGVSMNQAANSWVRNVTVVHFSNAVNLGSGAILVTVQDCACLKPVSKITGGRRYAFDIGGQYCLIQRCYSDNSRHAEVTSAKVCGPNVFLDCLAENTHADTGPHQRWAVGILWDNLKGGEFNAQDRRNMGSGHGWSGAQQVFWNCETHSICVQKPPTAQNYAIGCTKKTNKGPVPDRTAGHYESHGAHVTPRSLYLKQLEDRLGMRAIANVTTEAQRKGTIYDLLKKNLAQ